MKQHAGTRLFEIIGELPEEMILEADQDVLQEELRTEADQDVPQEELRTETDQDVPQEELRPETGQNAIQGNKALQNGKREELRLDFGQHVSKNVLYSKAGQDMRQGDKSLRHSRHRFIDFQKLGGYLKYLPVAACLCIVFSGAYFIVNNYYNHSDSSYDFSMSEIGSPDMAKNGDMREEADVENRKEETEMAAGQQEHTSGQAKPSLPIRFDAYEGPVIAMTATGDTQSLKTSRNLKCEVTTEKDAKTKQPLLHVTDFYKIKNTSKEDKTVQLVYPFAATLNLAYNLKGEILKVHGQEQAAVKYDIGDCIHAETVRTDGDSADTYHMQKSSWTASMDDYQQLFDNEGEYQKRALAKEADWNREVSVYTFSEIQLQEDSVRVNNPAVVGVTVYGPNADVLTCGFDYSSDMEDGMANHCFFVSEDQSKLMLILTGEQEREPTLGYYTNLDCEAEMDGIQCTMQKQRMSYSDAIQLCATAVVKQMQQDYEQNVYAGELPEYFDTMTAYQALTMISEEDEFYDTLVQQYQSTELKEVCEKLFGETRLVYALTTVTIPAKKTLKVTARMQKRQSSKYFTLLGESREAEEADNYQFDFLSSENSLLNVEKTIFWLSLPKKWQITDSDLDLKRAKSIWKANVKEKSYQFSISSASKP